MNICLIDGKRRQAYSRRARQTGFAIDLGGFLPLQAEGWVKFCEFGRLGGCK